MRVNRQISRFVNVVQAVVNGVRSDRVGFVAASLAYYAFVSMLPLLLLAIVAISVLGGPQLANELGAMVGQTLGPQAGDLVVSALTGAAGRSGATVAGIAVLLWSALKLFRGLDVGFSAVYGNVDEMGIVTKLVRAFVTLIAVGFGAAVTVGVGIAMARLNLTVSGVDVVEPVGFVALLAGLTLTFLPLYYVLPTDDVTIREALPGSIFAAIGWVALTAGFRVYSNNAGSYEVYGLLGGVLLLITFLYFGGLILLVGVVINAVIAGRIDKQTDLDRSPEARERLGVLREGEELSLRGTLDEIDVADDEELEQQIRQLREEVAAFEEQIDDRTVHRDELERDLKQYVRGHLRSGKARGWGPYLVLLYGTAMTLGGFYFLSGGWAILAMLVVWLSTLGLYALMVLVGFTIGLTGLPGRLKDRISSLRR